MISPRTILLAEQAFRAEKDHEAADLMRDAAKTISQLRSALRGLLDALPSATTHPAIKSARDALGEE